MRIRELRLVRYGKFTHRSLSLPLGERDIHIIVGPNEAGKSTVRSAISEWLFGIHPRTPLAFLHPMPELRIGGVIERLGGSRAIEAELDFDRTKGNRNTLRSPSDDILPEGVLAPWLGSLQTQSFNRMYALDHTRLVEGGAGILSASDDIGRMLFQSAAGLEHLGETLAQLQREADELWGPRRSANRVYYQASDAFEAASAELKNAVLRTKEWRTQHESLIAVEAELDAARKRDAELRQQLSRLERIRRVRPVMLGLDAARSELTELLTRGEIPLLPETAAATLDRARQSLALEEGNRQRLVDEIAHTRLTLDNAHVDRAVLALEAEITELNERRLQFRVHRTDIVKRSEEIRVEWERVRELASGLGWTAASENEVRARLPSAPARSRLQRALRDRTDLQQDLRAATKSLAERRQQVAQAQAELDHLAVHVVTPALAAAVDKAQKLGDHAATIAESQEKLASLQATIAGHLAALGPWRKTPEELASLVTPSTTAIQGWLDQRRVDHAERQTQQQAIETKTLELQRHELELQQFVRDHQPVSREDVESARRQRDEAWQSIRQTPADLEQRAPAYEAQVAAADDLADARLDRVEHEAARRSRVERIEQQRLELQALQARAAAVEARIEARAREWDSLTVSCGLPQLPLDVAPGWLERRQRVLDLTGESAQLARQLETRQQAAQDARVALWSALDPDATPTAMPELAECLRRARELIAAADQAKGQRRTLEQQLRDGQAALHLLEERLAAATSAWGAWEASWRNGVVAAGYPPDVAADQVEAELDGMQSIERLLEKIRSIRTERIDAMQADLDGLARMAGELATRAGIAIGDRPAEDIAIELSRLLTQAQQAAATEKELQSRLARSQASLAASDERRNEVRATLAPLMQTAGTSDVEALAIAIERSARRRDTEREIRAAEQQLAQFSDGLAEAEVRREVAEIGPDELTAELDRLTELSRQAVEQIANLSNRHGVERTAFEVANGADTAARAEAVRQEAVAVMADAAERYLKLHTASRLLRWSMEKFRETQQGPMLAKASTIFRGLTLESFSRLLADSDEGDPQLLGIRSTGEQVDVAGMSEGSRDQLYLALRLAALELQVDQGFSLPLIADDLFINFDDARTSAGLEVLGELSRKMQVVFLTHHDHLVPLARSVLGDGVNVVEL